jgi:polysaccharide pyruvyl transferase WcaK-like protein
MFGISYVGDGVHKFSDGLSDYSSCYYAKKFNIPYNRFIQSYGPFNDYKVRYFAKKEFDSLPFIYARGKNSASYCRVITKSKVYDIPDLAVLLNKADENWTNLYLKKLNLKKKSYIVISPSSVIYNLPIRVGGSIREKHVESIVKISKILIDQGNQLLFLPHMYSDNKLECDREVCYLIVKELSPEQKNNVRVVEDDIDAMQAKSLIASSTLAVVSRYHALIAAVSEATPVVTIGWNIKYYDLMEYYGIEDMAIDARQFEPDELLKKFIEKKQFYENTDNQLVYEAMSKRVDQKVLAAVKHFENWIVDATRKN